MIRFIFLFCILGGGLFLGTQFSGQQGYVLISAANTTIETSVTTLVIFTVLLLAALFALENILKKSVRVTFDTWNWFSVRKLKRARRYTNEGIVKLIEGDWRAAEKKVTRWSNHHDMPLLCYLIAAEAAHAQNKDVQRDQYLALASEQDNSGLAVGLTKAKQAISEHEYGIAYDTLTDLRKTYPENPVILNLLKTSYAKLDLWQPLLELLPHLKKQSLVELDEFEALKFAAQSGKMKDIASQKGVDGLISHWDSLSKKEKQDSQLIACFAELLIERQADKTAFTVLKESTKKSSSPDLFHLFPKLKLKDRYPVIRYLEATVKKTTNSAEIYSALAQVQMKEELWSDAQGSLEAALKLREDIFDYGLLADTLRRQNYNNAANDVTQKAIGLVNLKQ